MKPSEDYLHNHYIHRSNWLRAAVLGANDGIISITSIAIGMATADLSKQSIILATTAGLVAGALSMAAGEYVSVSSQTDLEKADLERERQELIEDPIYELNLLASIYEKRGLKKETALLVATEMTEHDALKAHVRDELGITDFAQSDPLQAALASGLSFAIGGLLPLVVCLFFNTNFLVYSLYCISLVSLILLGYISAKAGGAEPAKAILRVTLWGTMAMAATAYVGHLFGVQL